MSAQMTVPRGEQDASPRKSRSGVWKMAVVLVVLAGVGGALFASGVLSKSRMQGALNELNKIADSPHSHSQPPETPVPVIKTDANRPWDHLIPVSRDGQSTYGFNFAEVKGQNSPLRLELTGRTAYDTNTITKVRPRFDARVEKVYAEIGQKVKKGDPLVDLYSTDLAAAKTDFQTKYVQWQHDLKLYNLRKKLVETGAISQQLWVDTQNDEQKSRLDYAIAHDKLTIFYEIAEDELQPLVEHIGDKVVDTVKFGNVTSKAKMTLRAKADGYVITREVVPGNFYQETDVLMEIAPLDHLWVWVNVYELDQDKVRVGQIMEIEFPFLVQTKQGRVDYVAPEVSKDTRAVKVRVSIPNPDARLKSDMLVKAFLEIPPLKGQTVVPRNAMVALSGGEFVFIRLPDSDEKPGESPEGTAAKKGTKTDRFERIQIRVAQENTDNVIVASGLQSGQTVVTNGSLILAQLYEDQRMTATGMPSQ